MAFIPVDANPGPWATCIQPADLFVERLSSTIEDFLEAYTQLFANQLTQKYFGSLSMHALPYVESSTTTFYEFLTTRSESIAGSLGEPFYDFLITRSELFTIFLADAHTQSSYEPYVNAFCRSLSTHIQLLAERLTTVFHYTLNTQLLAEGLASDFNQFLSTHAQLFAQSLANTLHWILGTHSQLLTGSSSQFATIVPESWATQVQLYQPFHYCHTDTEPLLCSNASHRRDINSTVPGTAHAQFFTPSAESLPYPNALHKHEPEKPSKLRKHFKFRHSTERIYKCDTCFQCFEQPSKLRTHFKFRHGGERPYKCDICSKSFKERYRRDDHRKTHSTERPFQCDMCSATAKTSLDLSKHQRWNHGERPYQCDKCFRSFIWPSKLRAHQETSHGKKRKSDTTKRFKCDMCPRAYTRPSSLKTHISNNHSSDEIANGTKWPFQCRTCRRLFEREIDLNPHHDIHKAKTKPFHCDICSSEYVHIGGLRKHMEGKHTAEYIRRWFKEE